jgi:hypothetical protein
MAESKLQKPDTQTLKLRIDPEQDLVRELIAGGCSGLPKGNVENIPIGVIGNARCFHRFSPPGPKDLVSGNNKIILGAARNKAETDNGDDRTVAGGQPALRLELKASTILRSISFDPPYDLKGTSKNSVKFATE